MSIFKFKKFIVNQSNSPQKIGTDAMVLGALANPQSIGIENPNVILDVGTGCGVIALMLAQHYPNAKVIGLDIDEQAVLQAKSNFQNSNSKETGFTNEFEAVQRSFLMYFPLDKVDLIVSNPPYFNTKMPSSDQQRSLARHESSMSLYGLISHSAKLLSENGELWMIIPSERTEELSQGQNELKLIQRIKIFGKPDRHVRDVLVFSKSKNETTISLSELTIRDNENQYTKQYKELTIDFHFNTL